MQQNHIRKDLVKILTKKEGQTAANLGAVEILTALYKIITHNPRRPNMPERDRVVITKELEPIWNTTLAHIGQFAKKQLHEPNNHPYGEENPTNTAIGHALAAKIDTKKHQTYCIINDTEHHKGQHWEAIMQANKHKLNNLTIIINRNNTTKHGYIEDTMPIESLKNKYQSFNWNTIEVDGHNIEHIKEAILEAKQADKPTAIIAHTTPGKGISFIENKAEWHTRQLTKHELEEAIKELK